MQHRETRDRLPCKIVLVRIIEALAILVLLPTVTVGQQPLLQITSPTNGAVVVPGQNVVVSVSSPAGAAFAQADVIGQNPIGSSPIATAIPAQFTVAIPADIGLGQYLLTAEGTTSAGQDAESTAIAIDVERSDIPTLLSPSFASLTFSRVGQSSPVDIVALFSDGSILDVSNSSYISFTSTNPNVAVVDGHGLVTALASGSGYIIAAYAVGGGTRIASLPIKVPSSVTGGVNNFSIAATPFRQTVLSGSSVTYTISVSPMA